jgi:hypothetical protein
MLTLYDSDFLAKLAGSDSSHIATWPAANHDNIKICILHFILSSLIYVHIYLKDGRYMPAIKAPIKALIKAWLPDFLWHF